MWGILGVTRLRDRLKDREEAVAGKSPAVGPHWTLNFRAYGEAVGPERNEINRHQGRSERTRQTQAVEAADKQSRLPGCCRQGARERALV